MSRFSDLIDSLESQQAQGNWRGVLVTATNAVIGLLQDPRAKTVVLGSPEVDRHCIQAGATAWASLGPAPQGPFDDGLVVYIATELMKNLGGHTLALRDVIMARPQARHLVLLSNLHDKALDPPDLAAMTGLAVQTVVAPPGDLGAKTLWLMMALRQLRAGRLILFNHHYDSACIAAAQPGAAAQVLYFHHCDHDMALGVYMPHAIHVDCINIMHERCRHHLRVGGAREPVYWPLVSADLGARSTQHLFLQHPGGLVSCSHGSQVKFLSLGRYGYFELMRRRLQELPGRHLHLGGLPEGTVEQFRQTLAAADIDPSRFEHVQPVPSLWAWLRDSAIDIVISSFPIPGFKGLVETMGAGVPVLMHDSTLDKVYSTPDMVYPGALSWRTPDELIGALRGLDADALQAQASAARAHYECWHHPRELAYAVNNPRLSTQAPPITPLTPDTLALYWR